MSKKVVVEFVGDTSKLDSAFAKVKGGSNKLGGAVKGALAGVAVGLVVDQVHEAISAASDLNEAMSKSATIFGVHGAAIEAWAQQGAADFGLSKRAALDAAAGFGNMFDQLGISSDRAAQMSQNIVELAADFASFHNADISQVLDAQSAAFRGEYDSLQRFLPLINAASVEQEAMAMTGKKNKDALTAQEKALAVNNLMLKGAGAAAGDFDRTSGSLANQQRTLAANIENTRAIIGQKLQPAMNTVVQWLNTDGIPGFLKLTEVIGEGMADAAAFFLGALADIASGVAQTLEKVDQFIPGMEGVPETLQDGVTEMRRMEAELHNVRVNLDFATGAAADHAAQQQLTGKAVGATTGQIKDQSAAAATLKDAQFDARAAALSLKDAQDNLSDAQDKYNELLRTGGIDMEKVKRAQEDLISVQKDVEKATMDVAKAQEAVNEALKPATAKERLDASDDEARAQNDLTLAKLDAQDAQKAYSDLVYSGTATQEELTRAWVRADEAARDVRDAEDRVSESRAAANELAKKGTTDTDAYKDAVANLGTKQDALKTALDQQKIAQDALTSAQSIGKTETDALADAADDLARAQLDVDQKTWGAEKANKALTTAVKESKDAVRDLWGNVVGLKEDLASGWVVDPALNALVAGPVLPTQTRAVVGGGGGGIARVALPRAGGGSVASGHPYVVGELGPELFVPGRNGTIIPNGAGSSTVVNVYFTGVVGDRAAAAREIQKLLLEEQRKSGGLGFN